MNGFVIECLADLNESLRDVGTKLHVFMGCPVEVFRFLHREFQINKLCFIQDCEPIWHARDEAVKGKQTTHIYYLTSVNKLIKNLFTGLCQDFQIEVSEHVAHTLWDPMDIIAANGGSPPLTYEMFVVCPASK